MVSKIPGFRAEPVSATAIGAWIEAHQWDSRFLAHPQDKTHGTWRAGVHGALMLERLFSDLSDTWVAYDKVRHGEALTDRILENAPEELEEVAEIAGALLSAEASP